VRSWQKAIENESHVILDHRSGDLIGTYTTTHRVSERDKLFLSSKRHAHRSFQAQESAENKKYFETGINNQEARQTPGTMEQENAMYTWIWFAVIIATLAACVLLDVPMKTIAAFIGIQCWLAGTVGVITGKQDTLGKLVLLVVITAIIWGFLIGFDIIG
jgi:hypothetical protein